MQSFEHYDLSSKGLNNFVKDVLPKANHYDIVIFDVDILGEQAVHLANMFYLLNPKIKIVAYHDDSNSVCSELFKLTIHKPIGYQRFIRQLEKAYSNRTSLKKSKEDYSNLKILLVEDVELNRIYEVEMLKNFFGVTCDTAENGAIALEKAKEKQYDIILMDMRMPIMNGLDSTRKIREFDKDIPIVCMSANVYKEDKIAAEESGMNDFIEKPLERSDIEGKLLKLINNEFESNTITQVNYRKVAYAFLRENFEEEMVQTLCKTARKSIKDSLTSIESHRDNEEVNHLVDDFHRLKGVFFNLGLKEFASEAGVLQKYAQEKDFMQLIESKEVFVQSINQFLSAELVI
jgi:CheY-like chemotaxis protein